MELKRFTEWLRTVEGFGAAVIAVTGIPASVWVAVTDALDPVLVEQFGLPPWSSRVVVVVIIAALGMVIWRSYRRFAQASRVEQPDAFTLHPTDPTSLIGRTTDLEKLSNTVKQNRVVLLDGESGCGKSALVTAGLAHILQQSDGLLPLVIRDWGEDWVRGPLSTALDVLFHAVSQTDRNRLGWASSPDLAADTVLLATDFELRLKALFNTLGRRPLLIADQFDDYQALHRHRFIDNDGNWLAPKAVANVNQFWGLVSTGLRDGRIHLLVVTRADTAAGLSCVHFLAEDQTATRTLPRVEVEYLRPLLAGIADKVAQPLVVSNPDAGWHELRERLEMDLKAEGAILMQQVRIVLLGLRQLPLLTTKCYRSAGSLRGVETLVVSRALQKAGGAVGGGEEGMRTSRAVLGKLILPGGPNQPPKARRAPMSLLDDVAGSSDRAAAILNVLQENEVIRPAQAIGASNAWQLDHDYLATAVLAEARQADRWSVALREGKARYDESTSEWRRKWASLLPFGTLLRVCWERARGRLIFADAARYARVSAIRPGVVVLCLTLIGTIGYRYYDDQLLTTEALQIIDKFGGSRATEAALQAWRAPEPLRRRVHDLLRADDARFERAIVSGWALAHSGLEPVRIREVTAAIRSRLDKEPDSSIASRFAEAYAAVASKLNDPAELKTAANYLRARLEKEPDSFIASSFAKAYAAVASKLNDPAELKAAANALRARLEKEPSNFIASSFAKAYAAVASKLNDPAELKAAANALRARLEKEPDSFIASSFAETYAAVASKLNDPAELKAAANALRARLDKEPDSSFASSFAEAYAAVASKLNDPAELKAAANYLRARLDKEPDSYFASRFAQAYAAVASKLNDPAALKAEANALRARLEKEPSNFIASSFAKAYAAVASKLNDPAALKAAANALRARLEKEPDSFIASSFAEAYAAVASKLNDPAELKTAANYLRARLEKEPDSSIASRFAEAYAAVASKLNDPAELKAAANALRARLEKEPNSSIASRFAQAYAAVASKLNDPAALKAEANALRTRLEKEPDSFIASSFAQAYAAVASKLNDPAELKAAANYLRARLEKEPDSSIASSFAEAYAAVASKLNDPAELKAAANALRARLEKEPDSSIASSFAQAYAAVAGVLIKGTDGPVASMLVREILTSATHPFLEDISTLLTTLRSVAREDFGSDVDAAVRWATQTYGIKPEELRQSLLQR